MEPFVTEKRSWDRKDVAALLASKSALVELDADTALAVVRLMSLHRFKAGDVIIQEGASNTSFLVLVLRGEVVVENEGLSRADSTLLGVVGPGSVLGEMGLFDGEPRSATCKASTDVDAALLSRDALAELSRASPQQANKLLATLLARLTARLRTITKKLRQADRVNHTLQTELGQLKAAAAASAAPKAAPPPDSGMIRL
ncbi:MAG: cyclic nucleotide-binding domain-containing protein [Proteobacteria bacterium]|jgi:CRP/FNR family cyclic AMP-dependent transcriptional regulator|nr:cyclic nucleotide-binding domain-containing protein [Ramlibacter sp.]MCA0214165.1 cyclic nucleotide-binding domain-containing protein [Pseudomonadota bacterium]